MLACKGELHCSQFIVDKVGVGKRFFLLPFESYSLILVTSTSGNAFTSQLNYSLRTTPKP